MRCARRSGLLALGTAVAICVSAASARTMRLRGTASRCERALPAHGVGRVVAGDRTQGGEPVTNFRRSNAIYLANRRLDRDKDGSPARTISPGSWPKRNSDSAFDPALQSDSSRCSVRRLGRCQRLGEGCRYSHCRRWIGGMLGAVAAWLAARSSSQAARDARDALAASLKPQVQLTFDQDGSGGPVLARAFVVGPLSPAGLEGVASASDVVLQFNTGSGRQGIRSIPTLEPGGSRLDDDSPHVTDEIETRI